MLSARPLISVFLIVVLGCIPMVVTCWRRRSAPGAVPLGFVGLGMVIWSLGALIQLLDSGVFGDPATVGTAVGFLGIAVLPPAWLAFALRFSGRPIPRGTVGLASVVAVASALAALTNEQYSLLWKGVRIGQETVVRTQPAYWCIVAYAYGLMLAGVVVLVVNGARQPWYFRRRSLILAGAGLIPLVTSVLVEMELIPRAPVDLTPVAFPVSLALANWSLFRFRVLDLVAVPAEVLVEHIREGLLVVDREERIVALNQAGAAALGIDRDRAIGGRAGRLSADWGSFREWCHADAPARGETTLGRGDGEVSYEVSVTPVRDREARWQGYLFLFQDITERRRREREREQLLAELQQARTEIKRLSGLLPICSACKKIQDESGHWHRLEAYIRAHSEATFTHGLCPDCVRKFEQDLPPR